MTYSKNHKDSSRKELDRMKKNTRMISLAAAALLAVAPVVASPAVADAASITVGVTNGESAPATTNNQDIKLSLSVNNINAIENNSAASSLSVSLTSNYGNLKQNGKVYVYHAKDVKNGVVAKNAKAVSKLSAGNSYVVVANDVTISGLTANGEYTVNGKKSTADTYGNITKGFTVVSSEFTTPDKSLSGTPYFAESNSEVTSGSITLGKDENNVDSLVNAIAKKYLVKIAGTAKANWSDLKSDVENGLKSAGISYSGAKGDFSAPANTFTLTVNASASNTKTASMPITVTAYNTPADYSDNPVITYNGTKYDHSQKIDLADNASFNYVSLNGTVDTNAIQLAFSATTTAADTTLISTKVDTSKVNTAVAGKYPVTVTATNANGKTITLTFDLTVGQKGATYKTVKATENTIPVYEINGNTVTQTTDTVANNANITTFGTTTVKGISYTRVNSEGSNHFIETKYVDGSATQETEKGESYTVMHDSQAYDKDGKKVDGVIYKSYKQVSIVPKKVTINGKTYYKIANKDQYVRVTNITGQKRTLKRNAYIYATSTKRANRRFLKKGTKVTTYGGSYKFKNGKRYFRIEGATASKKMYVRTSNF